MLVLWAMWMATGFWRPRASWEDIARSWDGSHYVDLANGGYSAHLRFHGTKVDTSLHAFLPGYPLLIRLVDHLTPLSATVSAVLLSLAFGAVAAVLVSMLADRLYGRQVAEGTTLLFCLFPGTFVFNWAYSESLMIALSAACFLCILRKRMLTAGLLAGLATFTRPNAMILVASFGLLVVTAVVQRREVREIVRMVVATLLSASGFVAFNLFLWYRTDVPNAWFRVEKDGFGQGIRPGHDTARNLRDFITDHFHSIPAGFTWIFVAMAVGLIAISLRSSLPCWMRLYCVLAIVFSLTAAVAPSSPRLELAAFPALIPLAQKVRGPALSCLLAFSASFLVLLVLAYGTAIAPPFYMWAP